MPTGQQHTVHTLHHGVFYFHNGKRVNVRNTVLAHKVQPSVRRLPLHLHVPFEQHHVQISSTELGPHQATKEQTAERS